MLMINAGVNHNNLILNKSELYIHEQFFFQDFTDDIFDDNIYWLINQYMKYYSKKKCFNDEKDYYT